MKSFYKRFLAVFTAIVMAVCIVPLVNAADEPCVYLEFEQTTENGGTVSFYFAYRDVFADAEFILDSADGVTVNEVYGNAADSVYVDAETDGSLVAFSFGGTESPADMKKAVLIGTADVSLDGTADFGKASDMFTVYSSSLNGEDLLFKLYNYTSETEPVSEEPTSEEPTSEEPVSEEPTSEEPTSEEPTSEEPTVVITSKASVTVYVYEDFAGQLFGAVYLDAEDAQSVSFDLIFNASKAHFGSCDSIPLVYSDKAGTVIKESRNDGTVSFEIKSDNGSVADGYILSVPIDLVSESDRYGSYDGIFSLGYGFVNGEKFNIPLEISSSSYNPAEKGDKYFKGFDASLKTYGDGEEKRYEYTVYAAGAGFADSYSMILIFDDGIEITDAVCADENAVCTVAKKTIGNVELTVSCADVDDAKTSFDRKAIVTITVVNGGDFSYDDFWKKTSVDSFVCNSKQYVLCTYDYASYMDFSEHYDIIDGVKYISYDYDSIPRYTAVAGYDYSLMDENVTVPSTVRKGYTVAKVNANAFKDCPVKSITLPDSVEIIGDYAFAGCTEITGFTMPKGTYTVGVHAFDGCTSLTDTVFPEPCGLENIGAYAFLDCPMYRNIRMPASDCEIGEYAFGFVSDGDGVKVSPDAVLVVSEGSPLVEYGRAYNVRCIQAGLENCDILTGAKVTLLYDKEKGYIYANAGNTVNDISDIFTVYGIEKAEILSDGNYTEASPDDKLCTGMHFVGGVTGDIGAVLVVKGDADMNGKLTTSDAKTALRAAAQLTSLTACQRLAVDVNGDDRITTSDVKKILRVVAGLETFD